MDWTNKIAFVTGSSTGVGKGIANALCQKGATVIISARKADTLEDCIHEFKSNGFKVFGLQLDVQDAKAVETAILEIRKKFGALHFLVNNAGVTGPHQTDIVNYDIQEWQTILQTNISGMFYTMKYALPLIEKSGGGSVVNLSAVNGLVGIGGIAPYTCTKHAVIGLTKSVALEYAQKNIRINAVAPGYVDTENMKLLPDDVRSWMKNQHPMLRMASVEEIAQLVLFLLSDLSSFTTGSVYTADGGYLAQ